MRDVFDAAEHGDPLARELRAGLARGVAAAVRVLVLTADVDTVVLGGGVTALGDRLMADVAAELAASAEASPFMRSLQLDQRVELLPAGSPAAALGAALVGAPATRKGRSPMAEIVIVPDAAAAGAIVADEIVRLVRTNPEAVLGLATGSTPLPVYEALRPRLAGRRCDPRARVRPRRVRRDSTPRIPRAIAR